jgi:PAS domain S-box-containing protein
LRPVETELPSASAESLGRRVLILTPSAADAPVARQLLAEAGIDSLICADLAGLCERLAEGAAAMLIAEEALIAPEIDVLLAALGEQPPWSDIPLVVLTTADDTALSTARLLGLFESVGSMTLLERPFRAATLLSTVQVAMRAREKQYESRRLTEQAARATEALARSEERLRLVIDSSRIGTWTLELPGYRLTASSRCRQIFGRDDEHPFSYRQLVDAVHPDDRGRMRQAVAAALRDGSEYDLDYRILRGNGGIGWVAMRGRAFFDASGKPTFMAGTALDVSERKAAESLKEQLLQAERRARAAAERENAMKDEFLATLSHELRTPLAAVLGWTQVLRRAAPGGEERQRAVAAIERNALAQKRLIGDLLDMSAISAGSFELERQPLSLDAVADAAIEAAKPLAAESGVELHREGHAGGALVIGDRRRLEQVAWNLLANAIKFSPRGSQVRVHVGASRDEVRLTVSDSGVGIAPEFLPHAFERFRQQDSSTRRVHGGLGLGLSIVRHLVVLHGGRVHAHSEGTGFGATFLVALPNAGADRRERADEATGHARSAVAEPAAGRPGEAPLRHRRWADLHAPGHAPAPDDLPAPADAPGHAPTPADARAPAGAPRG